MIEVQDDFALHAQACDYLCQRVLDAFLREDVRGCVSAGEIVSGPENGPLARASKDGPWLRFRPGDSGELWLMVTPGDYMQRWRFRMLPALWCKDDEVRPLYAMKDILACFRAGLDEEEAEQHKLFEEECDVAACHARVCDAERRRLFDQSSAADLSGMPEHCPPWAQSFLHHDRLAAFHDHPFYPTARAKPGFSPTELRAWCPEFMPRFNLRWLAMPRALYHGSTPPDGFPWPRFTDVGLPAQLADDYVLIPVHPHFFGEALEARLRAMNLHDNAVLAPRPWLAVQPTLSVRTVVLVDAPQWHLKLPLTMRTLGARNIRTIKPSTIPDGALVQKLLLEIGPRLAGVDERLLLTDESFGGHVADQPFLGFILRRYPEDLSDEAVVSVAALAAPAANGRLVIENLATRLYEGDVYALFQEYLELTLAVHLGLWLRFGMALESNQQNSMVVLSGNGPRLRLLLKDNDAPRIHGTFLARHHPELASFADALRDRRIVVNDELPLAQMFTTITLQLNLAAPLEALAATGRHDRRELYRRVRDAVAYRLEVLGEEGADVSLARRLLLENDELYLKYLLRAATLESKHRTGAADVNKFYGKTAPNFLRLP